jgi:hypothetical protein
MSNGKVVRNFVVEATLLQKSECDYRTTRAVRSEGMLRKMGEPLACPRGSVTLR